MKIPFISNLKKPSCASRWDVLELATLQYSISLVYSLYPNLFFFSFNVQPLLIEICLQIQCVEPVSFFSLFVPLENFESSRDSLDFHFLAWKTSTYFSCHVAQFSCYSTLQIYMYHGNLDKLHLNCNLSSKDWILRR